MQNRNSPLSPEVWLHDLFTSKAVQQGTVIRRKARDIERFAGMDLFLREIDRRGTPSASVGWVSNPRSNDCRTHRISVG